MLCCDTCGTEARDVEDLAVFVSQLAALGAEARIHVQSVPPGLARNVQFDLAPYLVDRPLGPADRVVLLGAQRLTDDKLVPLRRLAGPGVACSAFGTFATRQAAIGIRARLSYIFGRDPDLHELAADEDGEARATAPVFGGAERGPARPVPRLLLVEPDLSDGREVRGLVALSLSRHLRVAILTNGRAKSDWQKAHGTELPVYHYGEVLPADLAEQVEVCACFRPLQGNYRLQTLVANLACSGGTLLDATSGHGIAAGHDGFVRAPTDLVTLAPFLEADILPNLGELGQRVRASRSALQAGPEAALRTLAPAPSTAPAPATSPVLATAPAPTAPGAPSAGVTFVPTNGIGLGHAQRCALVAQELETAARPVFAAFPSCTGLVKSYGFDVMPLIGRSAFHAHSFENDLANYVRLRALTARGSTLVFDGGYVFDSIYRTIQENRLRGVWIRRGLWQATQNNTVALDREKAFSRVIVPREAFDELNVSYSRGDHLREVGPIVRQRQLTGEARAALRAELARRYGLRFDRLVVTLLGGGVAAERGAQIQAACAMMERRPDTLHLVVVWPGARQDPAWFGWTRSRVVRTRHAGTLLAAADLCIGAAGYNLFHEVLYTRVPAIFVPQTGPFMDDQTARAAAAAERGLAALVQPTQLMQLDREVARLLEPDAAAETAAKIAAAELPEPGNAAAAHVIRELDDGDAGLFRPRGAHLAAPRG